MNTVLVLLVILGVVRFVIFTQVALTARRNNLANLYWLAAFFGLSSIYVLFANSTPPTPLSNAPIFTLGGGFGQFCLALFVRSTFYPQHKNWDYWLVGLFVADLIGVVYGLAASDNYFAALVTTVATIVNWTWHLVAAWRARQRIMADSGVEDWIKARYRLMIAYTVFGMLSGIQALLATSYPAPQMPPIVTQSAIVFAAATSILQLLVWVTPEGFRRWLSRDQQVHSQARRQIQAQTIVTIVTASISEAEGSNISIISARAIRDSVGKMIQSDDNDAIDTHLATMSYNDWDALLSGGDLPQLIHNISGKNVAEAMTATRRMLAERQSLFTMSAR